MMSYVLAFLLVWVVFGFVLANIRWYHSNHLVPMDAAGTLLQIAGWPLCVMMGM